MEAAGKHTKAQHLSPATPAQTPCSKPATEQATPLERFAGNQLVQSLASSGQSALPNSPNIPSRNRGTIRAKLQINEPGDEYEQEADLIANRIMRMPKPAIQRACACGGTCPKCLDKNTDGAIQTKPMAPTERLSATPADIVHEVLRSPGQPLDSHTEEFMAARFGHPFHDIRIHHHNKAADAARSLQARAFTVKNQIVFGRGQYAPHSPHGKHLLAHELTHVLQQRTSSSTPTVQRANAADARLPLDQAEALSYAQAAKTEIDNALAVLTASTSASRRDIATLVSQENIILEALTPRHDSSAGAGLLRYFTGQTGYSSSLVLSEHVTHHVHHTATTTRVRIRARDHNNIDNMLTAAEIEQRLVQAVTEVSQLMATHPYVFTSFDRYRAQFNTLWNVAPFATMSTRFNPAIMSSKGPRTTRARAIFDHIYQRDAALRGEYDANTNDIQERMDSYVGPDSLNLPVSPRLHALREVFFPYPVPIPNWRLPTFRSQLQAAANNLQTADREAVEQSNEWQRLINIHVTSDTERQTIRSIISTPPPAAVPTPAPTATPAPPTAPAPTGGGVTPQQFVDSVSIQGPPSPVLANARREQVTLTPGSGVANPNVAIQSRVTVTPANRVVGANISPGSTWPNAATSGTAFQPELSNTGTTNITAHLDLVNGPAGLTPTNPIPDYTFSLSDNRVPHFLSTWDAHVNFNTGAGQEWFTSSSTPRYMNGSQNFNAQAWLPTAQTNPGLTLSLQTRLRRGSTATPIATPNNEPFPPGQQSSGAIAINIPQPPGIAATGDNLHFDLTILDGSSAALGTSHPRNPQTVSMTVLPEQTYTKTAATTAANNDNNYLNDRSPTGLLGKMAGSVGTAVSPIAPMVAQAIAPLPPTTPPPGNLITLRSLTIRHDSAAFVNCKTGNNDPSRVGYFVGPNYANLPTPCLASAATPDSFVDVAGAAGFQLPARGPRFIAVNRTTDVAGSTPPRSDDELIRFIVHEAVHAMDVRPGSNTLIERYRTEFRAYWMDGRFGPPFQATCPAPTTPTTEICPDVTPACLDTAFRPNLTPPGPKSCRARAIFSRQLYGSTTYPWVKPAYDNDTNHFREQVDTYLIPDGINLIVSVRLEALRELIENYTGANFSTLENNVKGFMSIAPGPTPSVGPLQTDEQNEIRRNRAWRDLVNRKITNTGDRITIKGILNIPT